MTSFLCSTALYYIRTWTYIQKGVRWALHGKGGVRHAATNWVKQCNASTMCRPLESTAVRLRAATHEPPAMALLLTMP
jgi:hypothetical protein